MELMNKFILSALISTLFFTEALCLPRKLIGNEPIVHNEKKLGIGIGVGVGGQGGGKPLTIDSICAKTDYAPLCIQSLRAKLNSPIIDPLVLLKTEIDVTHEKVKNAMAKVNQLESKSTFSKDVLRVCKENYEFAIDSLNKAKLAIDKHDIGSVNSELSAVTTYASTCDDTFAESSVETSPLANVDEEVSHLGSNCLAITEQVKL